MATTIGWPEIALRLALAALAGAVLGLNRTERGMAAGLRTNLLVCLAAAVAMIEANLLLTTAGRDPDSFVQIDPMRLPLGVLTGMGFIGGGAILRRGAVVTGVTTAATLWLATVLGLCFGGGQYGLGGATLGLAASVLWLLKRLELRISQERRALLAMTLLEGGPTDEAIRAELAAAGYHVSSWDATTIREGDALRRKVRTQVRWQAPPSDVQVPGFVNSLTQRPGVLSVRWKA
jgi:putative Mg2+ transporter-C (MgtC) family protein